VPSTRYRRDIGGRVWIILLLPPLSPFFSSTVTTCLSLVESSVLLPTEYCRRALSLLFPPPPPLFNNFTSLMSRKIFLPATPRRHSLRAGRIFFLAIKSNIGSVVGERKQSLSSPSRSWCTKDPVQCGPLPFYTTGASLEPKFHFISPFLQSPKSMAMLFFFNCSVEDFNGQTLFLL